MCETITITNDISEISGLLKIITRLGNQHNIPEDKLADIKLVIEEAVSNIIFYGFDDDATHEIRITPEFSNTLVTLCIEDDGTPFNPVSHGGKGAGAPLEDYDQGGMGLIIIKELMDDIDYEFRKEKNTLYLKKRI